MAKKFSNMFEVFHPSYRFEKKEVILTMRESAEDTKKALFVVVFKTEETAKTELERLNRAFSFFGFCTRKATFGESAQVVKYDCFEASSSAGVLNLTEAFSANALRPIHSAQRSGVENGKVVLSFKTKEQAEKFAEELKFALKFCNEDAVVDTVEVFGAVVCFQKISEGKTSQTDPQAS